jgi:hypothetical protein
MVKARNPLGHDSRETTAATRKKPALEVGGIPFGKAQEAVKIGFLL